MSDGRRATWKILDYDSGNAASASHKPGPVPAKATLILAEAKESLCRCPKPRWAMENCADKIAEFTEIDEALPQHLPAVPGQREHQSQRQ